MNCFSLILVASGSSRRMGRNKLLEKLSGATVAERSLAAFCKIAEISEMIAVCGENSELRELLLQVAGSAGKKIVFVTGGNTRSESVRKGLDAVSCPFVLVHDAARPFVTAELIRRVVDDVLQFGSSVPALPMYDSIRVGKDGNIIAEADRSQFFRVQTPQGFRTEELRLSYNSGEEDTDESGLFLQVGTPHLTEGEERNRKITRPEDVYGLAGRVGTGFDVHNMVPGRQLVLGGLVIPCDRGEEAHSDGDVLLHAVMDALLSAVDERDIGNVFPDKDEKYKNVLSVVLLRQVLQKVAQKGKIITGISAIVALQKPKLASFLPEIVKNLREITAAEFVNLSATTTEHLGIVGAGGIAAYAVVTVI